MNSLGFSTSSFGRQSPAPSELPNTPGGGLRPQEPASPVTIDQQLKAAYRTYDTTNGIAASHQVIKISGPDVYPRPKTSPVSWLGYQRPRAAAAAPGGPATLHSTTSGDTRSSTHSDTQKSDTPGGSLTRPSQTGRGLEYWRNWLGYGEATKHSNADKASEAKSVVHLKEGRSRLSEAAKVGAVSWYQGLLGFLGLGRNVYVPPQIGEDICGLCHDNKPHMQMIPCSHRLCLVCAKKLCCHLDLHKPAVCPYCLETIRAFDMA